MKGTPQTTQNRKVAEMQKRQARLTVRFEVDHEVVGFFLSLLGGDVAEASAQRSHSVRERLGHHAPQQRRPQDLRTCSARSKHEKCLDLISGFIWSCTLTARASRTATATATRPADEQRTEQTRKVLRFYIRLYMELYSVRQYMITDVQLDRGRATFCHAALSGKFHAHFFLCEDDAKRARGLLLGITLMWCSV